MNVADLLQFLAAGRKTGMLRFDRGKLVKQIYFENGIIVGSNSNDPKEYLGQLLIHYGKLDESKLKAALQIQRKHGGRLGEILVSTGVLEQAEVLDILKIRTLDIIYELFLWEEAHFELYDNEAPPDFFIRIEVEPTKVIMDGVYRIDEWKRYRELIPSDRAMLELGSGWTSSLKDASKEIRQILFFIEKRMSVAEISYNMHASPFHVYGQLYELVNQGIARVAGEVPESFHPEEPMDMSESLPESITAARSQIRAGEIESAVGTLHKILAKEPKNSEARTLLTSAENKLLKQMYTAPLLPYAVPRVILSDDALTEQQLEPQEAFLLSRMNGEWDVSSILSICPFREIDSLKMIKTLHDRGIINF
jgi:hypothetical protein